MKRKIFFIAAILFSLSVFSQKVSKQAVQIINQSEKYKIVDNTFKLEKLFGDSSAVRLKTEMLHTIDTGSYIIKIGFYARWGIYSNDGILKRKIDVKPGKTVKVYLVGGDYSGTYASDPKIKVD